MTSEPVLLIEDAANVRTLTLNRPAAFNSLTIQLKEELLVALTAAATDDTVRAVILTGAGKAFCAGQDLKEHATLLTSGDSAPMRTVERHYNPITIAIAELPKPIIAAVNGTAAGAGAAFAYACDLRIAADSARFLMAFANAGLSADSGASWTLPRLVGYGRAMEMMLLAKPVTAAQALEFGMVTEVVADEQVLTTAARLAERMATGPTTAYASIKGAMLAAGGVGLAEALAAEASRQIASGATKDHAEAVRAFVDKRPPSFTGR